MDIYFVTENVGKYTEAAQIAAEFGVNLTQLRLRKMEIQSEELQVIASFAARDACQRTRRPVVADDSGFFVRALGGFPGPYSSYVYRTIGNSGILRILRSDGGRSAYFQSAVAFCKPRARPMCFSGIVNGSVSRRPMGIHGFGFDPIFIPRSGDGRTFAEMRTEEKNMLSHRGKAFTKFFEWYTS